MDKVHHLPTTDSIQLEASEWIIRLQSEGSGDEDRQQFERWKAVNPRHARAYEELSATWNDLRSVGRIARAVSLGQAVHASGLAADSPRRSIRRIGLALAAALGVVTVGIGIVWWFMQLSAQTSFQTAVGEHASIELPDGSRLELNSNSLARVGYTQRARVIYLSRGEAFFQVAHQSQRPFWVVAGKSWIRAVGTAFNVDLRPSGVRVLVSEGTVKVATPRSGNAAPSDLLLAEAAVSVLTAGQQAEMRLGSAAISPVPPLEQSRVEAWRKGTLYFDDQSLGSVIEEANRYTAEQIRIEDPALAQLLIGGTFEANTQGIDALLLMLKEGFRLQVRREDGQIFIGRAQSR
jgi:transmembrane sensor